MFGYCNQLYAVFFFKLIFQGDGFSTRPAEAGVLIDQDISDLPPVLFNEFDHALEFLAVIGFGALVRLAEGGDDADPKLFTELIDAFILNFDGVV